jgi:hypothetical protein
MCARMLDASIHLKTLGIVFETLAVLQNYQVWLLYKSLHAFVHWCMCVLTVLYSDANLYGGVV